MPEGQGDHGEKQGTPGLRLQPMMSRSGCEAWKESLMGSQNGMIWIAELINGVSSPSRGAKVKGGIGGREPHSFLGNLQEAHLLWEETVWMDRVNKSSQHSNQMRVSQESG